jgi:hypothetical protein
MMSSTGRAYIFYGPIAGSMIATDADVMISGEQINDGFGASVASAGDGNDHSYFLSGGTFTEKLIGIPDCRKPRRSGPTLIRRMMDLRRAAPGSLTHPLLKETKSLVRKL